MDAEDIRALRKRHGLSMKDLADRLGVEVALVISWESGDRYATKKHVDRMRAIDAEGVAAEPRRKGLYAGFLSDPRFAVSLRKLLAHEKLQDEFLALADKYDDPAEDP